MSVPTPAGFTGTRRGMNVLQQDGLEICLVEDGINILHLGDAIGADKEAWAIALRMGLWKVGHPPTNPRWRAMLKYDEEREPLPFLDRDHAIVDEGRRLYAAPRLMQEERRSGTWATIRYARRNGVPVTILWPNGRVER